MATDLERLTVRLEASLTQFDRDMRRATGVADSSARRIETRFAAMNANITRGLAGGVKSFAAPFLGLLGVHQLLTRTTEALRHFSDISEAAQSAGLSTDFFQTLTAAGLEYGAAQEDVTGAVLKFAAAVGTLQSGQHGVLDALKNVNPELFRQLQVAGSMETAIRNAADAVHSATDADQKGAIGKILFGKAWAGATRIVDMGSAGLTRYGQKAKETGRIVDADLIKKGDEIADAYAAATDKIKINLESALVSLSPILLRATNVVADFFADLNRSFDQGAQTGVLELRLANLTQNLENFRTTLASRRGHVISDEELAQIDTMKARMEEIKALKAQIAAINFNNESPLPSFEQFQEQFGPKPIEKAATPQVDQAALDRLAKSQASIVRSIEDKTEAEVADAAALNMTAEAALAYTTKLDILNQLTAAGVTITPQLTARVEQLANAYAAAKTQTDALTKANEFLKDTASEALKTFVGDLREGKTAAEALLDMLNKIADKLIDLALNAAINLAFSGGALGGGTGGLAGAISALFKHKGGMVGPGGPTRQVPASTFAAAPRLHSGLFPGEFPAILQKGETVIPKGGGTAAPRTNIIVNNFSSEPVGTKERRNGNGDVDIEVVVGNMVAKQMARPGTAINRVLGQQFGVKPAGIRR